MTIKDAIDLYEAQLAITLRNNPDDLDSVAKLDETIRVLKRVMFENE